VSAKLRFANMLD